MAGTELVFPNKRSRHFLALSAPDAGKRSWAYEREQKLFESLRDACRTEAHVRYDEFPAAPSIVPYLMKLKPSIDTPLSLLGELLEFRESSDGKTYREWWQELRGGLEHGRVNRKVEQDIARVAAALRRRFGMKSAKASEARLSFEGEAEFRSRRFKAKGKIKTENLRLPRSEWLRRLAFNIKTLPEKTLPGGHSRLLLRLSLARQEHENLVEGMKRLWEAQ